jgi:hypothetical protein
MKVEAIVESVGYETLTTDELYSKLKSKEIEIVSKRKLKNPTAVSSSDVPMFPVFLCLLCVMLQMRSCRC